MEVSLEVLVSTNIKRKKPSPRLCWLGKQKEAVYIIDEKTLNEVNLRTGRVKKAPSRLQTFLKRSGVVAIGTSLNGGFVVMLLLTGDLFIWNKDLDNLVSIPANEEISQLVAAAQETSIRLDVYISGDGGRVLLVALTGSVFLWENVENHNEPISPKIPPLSRWSRIQSHDSTMFPSTKDKEATVHAIFIQNEILGDCCLCTFAYFSGMTLMMTFLLLRFYKNDQRDLSSLPYYIHWAQQKCSLQSLVPSCEPLKSRGALLARFSRDGLVLAITVNQRDPKNTHILFINSMNFVTISGHLRGCSSKDSNFPSKLIRSYWVGDMSWSADSLFLACLLKRGALMLLTRLGEILTLTTFGCSVEFGPAEFIPLHPLITYRSPCSVMDSQNANNSLDSAASEADVMRQRYSITFHPRSPYLIVSDGYMVTALRLANNFTPYYFMKSLLLDSAQRLEDLRQTLQLGKPKNNRINLRPLSSLKASLMKDHGTPYSESSTVPSFLLADKETLESTEQSVVQEDDDESDDDFLKVSALAEQGRLEFASMFDTMHARDIGEGENPVSTDVFHIQRMLLTAWTIGITVRNLEEKDTLLQYTVGCLAHYLSIIPWFNFNSIRFGKCAKMNRSALGLYLRVFQQCMTVLYWDVISPQSVKHILKLTSETIWMILTQREQLYSRRLVESVCLLKVVSRHLNTIYHLHYESVPVSSEGGSKAFLDFLRAPVFESVDHSDQGFTVLSILQCPPDPVNLTRKSEKRLVALWRLLYNKTLWYRNLLNQHVNGNPATANSLEERTIISLMCHIQAELQSSGQQLDQSLNLLPVNGEECFLLGSYKEAVDYWKKELQEITDKGGRRGSLLQTRYYLAILYCHLYNYNLNDAQGMCDQLVRRLLRTSSLLMEASGNVSVDEEQTPFTDVHSAAALAVIQSMGRFMAAYFTNQQLNVFPPHNVCVLFPLHKAKERLPRMISLRHSTVSNVVRDQNLSCVWTVDYALDLLLIGGLLPEAAWLANKLGDWKISVSIGVAYNLYLESIPEEFKRKQQPLPENLTPAYIFQEKLQAFLGRPPSDTILNNNSTVQKQFTDPIEEEDLDLLFSSVQEMLKAAVMADAEILTDTLHQLMESAKELSRRLPALVPDKFYLPAPPLYCPQPASVSEDDCRDLQLEAEKHTRQKLSGVLQRILLILRSAHCSVPAAQWYIKQIKRARKFVQKIRSKLSLSPLNDLPETLLNYSISSKAFFKAGPCDDQRNDHVSASIVGYFRELCALCWMLHVREKLSYSCRQYQKARDNGKLFKDADAYDSCLTEHCFEALEWACRMLPFTHIINCEELVHDIILSLVSELPPVKKVAEIMVRAFPHPQNVRVQLREKYQSVQQRLRHYMVKGLQGEEMMSIVMHNIHKERLKLLKRVQWNLGPMQNHLWESSLGDTIEEDLDTFDQFSLGTSLTLSTITDFGRPQVYSDADTISEAFTCNDGDERSERRIDTFVQKPTKNKSGKSKLKQKNKPPGNTDSAFPKVGTWEFEFNDEEYINFLDLFLSYLLEKDLHHNDPGIPFLTTFSQSLRRNELNSLVFDVHTTLKRRWGKAKMQSIFRAGCCYSVHTEPFNDSTKNEDSLLQIPRKSQFVPKLSSTVLFKKPEHSSGDERFKRSGHPVKTGLFGLREQKTRKDNPHLSSGLPITFSAHDPYSCKVIDASYFIPNEELGLKLKARFGDDEKLVEWMVRWSDRRLFWKAGKSELFQAQSSSIRVKTTSASILISIWLLERKYLQGAYKDNEMVHGRAETPVQENRVVPNLLEETELELQDRPSLHLSHLQSETESVVDVCDEINTEESISEASFSLISAGKECGPKHHPLTSTVITLRDNPKPEEIITDAMADPVEVLSESEAEQDNQPDTQRNPNISVCIRTITNHIENLPSEVAVELKEPDFAPGHFAGHLKGSESALVQDDTPPDLQTFPSAANIPSVETNPVQQTLQNGAPDIPPASEGVRHLLQDEMFRLLQLQQINFMSLMQVVGSSFAALPALHQIFQQTSHIGTNQTANLMEEHIPVQQHQAPLPTQSTPVNVYPAGQRPINRNLEMGSSSKPCNLPSNEREALEDKKNKESLK
ncbi:hypothetical protein GDO86_002473, partial [Hymenochirus boettgeri]